MSEECFGNQILKVPLFDEDDPRNENRKTVNKLSKHIDYSTLFFVIIIVPLLGRAVQEIN